MYWWGSIRMGRGAAAGRRAEPPVGQARFNAMLARERMRADRCGLPLAFVLFGAVGGPDDEKTVVAALEALRGRARVTDEIGRFDRKACFALLSGAGLAGAKTFASAVRTALRQRGIRGSYVIYQYHPHQDHDQADPPTGRALNGSTPPAPPQRRKPKEVVADALARAIHGHGSDHHDHDDGRAPEALSGLFIQPLPAWKRATDLVVAGLALVALWPVMVAVGLAIKLDSPGPMLFRQMRAGLGGRPFGIYKFRTMVSGAEAHRATLLSINEQDGPAFKLRSDPRVTRLGMFLRRSSLDELPQLLNILRGEMTLVGPRPLPLYETAACAGWQKRRLEVTPGLTCIWQIYGRSSVSFEQWMRMDLGYLRRRSPLGDLKLICATVPAVVRQRGAC